ncbi:oxygen-independent coproporphyrinogen III oxidase [Hyphomicrobium sp. CS1BSMeth3]|uniref:oxygen-independent coproporphyrinogen III oxidase n=1 Tax=Hyphomicrobium sp. CS1BSMeth3 TaxID=1892844 RepID=UPI000930DCC0|nr:oxygen-independent coproporphyrinogen III oxidase [Hyphomicrobium sp. CS1BSMeth3]
MIDYQAMARYADERLPRYTSYPTAPLFSSAVAAPDYCHWLAALPPATETSLYLHIPFCRSMCWYCGCHTTITRRNEPISNYVDVLQREIELVARHVPAPLTVRHVHFGGGTPTTIEPEALRALVARLRATFHVVPGAEIAIEIDPRTLTPDMTVALGEAGFTRASLGVQSFDPRVQKEINRVQSVDCTAAAVDGLRAAGIDGINFDLIYGLPLQTTASCVETVEQCLALQPDRFSVFGYAHVPKFKKHQRKINEAGLPGGHARHDQATAIADVLVAAGYVHVGLDHFARPGDTLARAQAEGRLRRNFQGYTTDACGALIGFGASAIGRLPQGYMQNEVALGRYADCIMQGELAAARGYRLTPDDILRADLIERLMCDLAVDVAEVCARHGITPVTLAPALIRLRALANEGIVHIDGARIVVADHARPLVRTVASTFDAYLGDSQRLYSRAV